MPLRRVEIRAFDLNRVVKSKASKKARSRGPTATSRRSTGPFTASFQTTTMSRTSISSIDASLAVIGAQLSLLRAQEADLQFHIDALQRTQHATRTKRERLELEEVELIAGRYPINWLPAEIIMLVFHHYTGDLFTLTHVNRKWRDIALSVPKLWTRLSTNVHPELVALSMERAGNLSLDLSLSGSSAELMLLRELVKTRVRSAIVECEGAGHMTSVSRHFRENSYPEMTELEISFVGVWPRDLDVERLLPEVWPLSYPKLQSLSLSDIRPLLLVQSHYTNLTNLSIARLERTTHHTISVHVLLQVLTWTQKLKNLVLSMPLVFLHRSHASDVHLPNLCSFEWSNSLTEPVLFILGHLRVPALTKLELFVQQDPHLVYAHPPPNQPTVAPVSALQSVTSLFLHTTHDEATNRVTHKFLLPALTALELTNTHGRTVWLPSMESSFHDPRLPNLTNLSLTGYSLRDVSKTLGFMPALIALSLDECLGMSSVLDALAKGRCPKLASLSFWDCDDLYGKEFVEALRLRGGGKSAVEGREIRKLPTKIQAQVNAVKPLKIESILLEDCVGVDEDSVTGLEELVGEVVCH